MLGQWLSDEARRWISRSHVRFELRGADLVVQDVSTNGTGVRPGGSMDDDAAGRRSRDRGRVLGPGDVVELYPGVQVARSRIWSSGGVRQPGSVMAEAPTMAMRAVRALTRAPQPRRPVPGGGSAIGAVGLRRGPPRAGPARSRPRPR